MGVETAVTFGAGVQLWLVLKGKMWYNVRKAAIILKIISPAYGDGVLYHSRCAFMV